MYEIWKIFVGEILGTMALVVLGNGVVSNVLLKRSKGFGAGWTAISFGWGFAILVGAFIGWSSGAHLNPAVSIAFLVANKEEAFVGGYNWCWLYFVCQFLGAMMGAVFVWLVYFKEFKSEEDSAKILACFGTTPQNRSYFFNTLTEILTTFILVLTVLVVCGKIPAITNEPINLGLPWVPLILALVVAAIGLSLGGPTGFTVNPVRDIGPRLVHWIFPISKNKGNSDWKYSVVMICGPMIGGILAGIVALALNQINI